MAGLFQKLFSKILGPRVAAAIVQQSSPKYPARSGAPTSIEEIKEGIEAETTSSLDSLKAKIASGRDDILADIRRKAKTAEEAIVEEIRRRAQDDARRRPWYQFIHLGTPLVRGIHFQSSNVSSVLYDREHQSLYVSYATGHRTDGRTYRYWIVTEREAVAAFLSSSKGRYVWDNLRIRGTLLGHRKNYALVQAAADMPRWTATPEAIIQHDIQVGQESGAAGPHQVLHIGATSGPVPDVVAPYAALGKFSLPKPKVNTPGQKAGISQDTLAQIIAELKKQQS